MKNLLLLMVFAIMISCENNDKIIPEVIEQQDSITINGEWLLTGLTGPKVYAYGNGTRDTLQDQDYDFQYLTLCISDTGFVINNYNLDYKGIIIEEDFGIRFIYYRHCPNTWYRFIDDVEIYLLTIDKMILKHYTDDEDVFTFIFTRYDVSK